MLSDLSAVLGSSFFSIACSGVFSSELANTLMITNGRMSDVAKTAHPYFASSCLINKQKIAAIKAMHTTISRYQLSIIPPKKQKSNHAKATPRAIFCPLLKLRGVSDSILNTVSLVINKIYVIEGVSLSVYPTEGSGKTCTKIKETAHTLGGYTGCEPMMATQGIFQPRRERVHNHLLYVSSLPDFSVQMKAKRFLCYVCRKSFCDATNIRINLQKTFIVGCFFTFF